MLFDIELRTIDTMRVIEQEGSIAKAAAALYISQPALTQYIKRVETQLSYPLYKREKGRLVPTEAGKVLLTEGKSLLAQYDSMIRKMESAAHTSSQEISLGWPTGYTVRYLDQFMSHEGEFGSVKIHITEESVENLIRQLLEKKLNLLLVPALYSHPDLVYHTLKQEEFYLAVPKNHSAVSLIRENCETGHAELSALEGMPFISLYAEPYKEFIKPLFREAGYKPDVIFRCKNWDSSHSLVEKGMGLAIVPYWFAEEGNDMVNYYRIKSNYNTYRTLAIVHLRNQPVSPEVRSLMDDAIGQLGDEHARKPFDYSILSKEL